METEINFLSGNMVVDTMFESGQSDAYFAVFNTLSVKDDDDDDEETDDTSNDDPPLNEDVVHSPVTTQPGGKPKS